MSKWVYIGCSYVIIGLFAFLGFRHINALTTTVHLQKLEIESLKQSQSMVIDAFNEEIKEMQEKAKERKETVKEIVKVVKGTDDEKCLNSRIPSAIIDRVRSKKSSDKK